MLATLNTVLQGRYEIQRELGRGGMASVWLARDLRHEREVAIKVLHPELAGAIGIDRFLREIKVTARLSHPGIVTVYDSGSFAGPAGTPLAWYAMPFVRGESLRDRLEREGQLPIAEAVRIATDASAALASAHREGVVHRDIKPENLLLSDGHVFIADFGLARAVAEADAKLTASGMSVGTPAYMSPEQVTGQGVDARTDQYALATVLYEMLAGEPPFGGPNAQAIMARRMVEPARGIRAVRSSVDPGLEAAVLKALERAPADRYPDVQAFAEALREPAAPRPGVSLRWLAAVVAIVIAVLGAWMAWSRRGPAKPDPGVMALYERGVQAYDTRTPAGVAEGIQDLRAAIARDSSYAAAWAALARAYVRAYERGFSVAGVSRDSLVPLAYLAANRALALDSSRADAWLTRGMTSRAIDPTDVAPAIRSYRRSLALDSSSPLAWHHLAMSVAESGNLDEALDAWRRSVRLDPRFGQGLAFLALAHRWRGQYDSAAVWADSALTVDPDYVLGRTTVADVAVERGEYDRARHAFEAARRLSTDVEVVRALAGLALTDARAGRRKEARLAMARAESLAVRYVPHSAHTVIYMAEAWVALGDSDRVRGWLTRFETPADLHFQLHLRCDPTLRGLRADSWFQALLIPSRLEETCR